MLIKPFPEINNVHSISIALPGFSDLITSNLYVVGNGPVTLIDTGPKFPGSFESILKEFEHAGLRISDIERIIITHGHVDHFGLAGKIIEIRADIPIILCTGFSEVITRELAVSLGIKGYLHKPVSMHEMARSIRKVLDA